MRGDLRVEEVEGARVSGGARRARGARGVVIPRRSVEKTRGTRFCARGGEREGARRRAPERGQRSYLPTALRSRPRPSSEKLGEYASTILSCGASVMGGRASGVESSRKRPSEKRVPRRFDRGAPIASFEARPGSYCPVKPKHSSFTVPFREIRKVAKWKLSREITQKINPGVSRNSVEHARGGSPHLACESGGPALRGARAARDARDRAGRAIDGRASTRPARNERPSGAARVRLPMRARAPGGNYGGNRGAR